MAFPRARETRVNSSAETAAARKLWAIQSSCNEAQFGRVWTAWRECKSRCVRRARRPSRPRPRDVFAFDGGGEGRLLHLLADALRIQSVQTGRTHECTGGDKTTQLVARVQRLIQLGDARAVGQIIRVRLNGVDHVGWVTPLGENGRAFKGMVGWIGPALIVEVVEEADGAPLLLVFAELASVGATAASTASMCRTRFSFLVYSRTKARSASRPTAVSSRMKCRSKAK